MSGTHKYPVSRCLQFPFSFTILAKMLSFLRNATAVRPPEVTAQLKVKLWSLKAISFDPVNIVLVPKINLNIKHRQ